MRSTVPVQDVAEQLEDIARRLDVPPSLYEEAQERYAAVCRWLAGDEHLVTYDPTMYSQGSFALGTVIRPPGELLHYDVDAVCVLNATPGAMTQKELKRLVGARLKDHETYARMLSPPSGGAPVLDAGLCGVGAFPPGHPSRASRQRELALIDWCPAGAGEARDLDHGFSHLGSKPCLATEQPQGLRRVVQDADEGAAR